MLNYRYRIKDRDTEKLDELITTSNRIWNYALMIQRKYYEWYGKYLYVNKLQKYIAKKRKLNPYWKKLNSHWVQEIVRRLDDSYQRFFQKIQIHPPQFKLWKDNGSVFAPWNVTHLDGVVVNNDTITLKNFGSFKFIKHRACGTRIRQVRLKRYNGRFYVIICCDCSPKSLARDCNGTAGIDFGLKTFITLDDGTEVVSPRFLFKHAKKLRKLSKVVSRRKKGSNRRGKAVKKLARFHERIVNQRNDWQWKLAHQLCRNYSEIHIEDLELRGWVKLWGRKSGDLALGNFILKLEFVASKYGTKIVKVDRYYPSSHICSVCGKKLGRKLGLGERNWQCVCGVVHDRDVNAAKCIKQWGTTVRGDSVRPSRKGGRVDETRTRRPRL